MGKTGWRRSRSKLGTWTWENTHWLNLIPKFQIPWSKVLYSTTWISLLCNDTPNDTLHLGLLQNAAVQGSGMFMTVPWPHANSCVLRGRQSWAQRKRTSYQSETTTEWCGKGRERDMTWDHQGTGATRIKLQAVRFRMKQVSTRVLIRTEVVERRP